MRVLSLRHLAATLLLAAGLASCESRPAAVGTPEASAASTPDSTATPVVAAAYVCPMNCEGSASDKPGKCPVCEMALQPNPAAQPSVQ
ncbi:heavy metal-binding domain-containing protein [Hymenobacter psychrotolerans]|uniref:Heavy metal binding domain-containing protein n=1 Tax=Hymenobacter psychrotolerans DSM 18569 TaxID=1121959 RepID=A0A1M7CC09_9BACT|nr:heavy metal-binding domain-containing protein [Hymenobacter psychrotolerans]SHL64697.1 hypothetical protein SAMN02746009_03120 [Hymenobacter psychrotolerans DSM 18569]